MRIDLAPEDRTRLVRRIFGRIVPMYDLLNRTLSLGRDAFWRRASAARAEAVRTGLFLDLAGGTGDQALALARTHEKARIVCADFTYPMLTRAAAKIEQRGLAGRVFPTTADACQLPFPDSFFDAVTMSFGIRNIPDKKKALAEMLRVLAPGGRVLILELIFPRWSALRRIYQTYLNRLIPVLGGAVSGDQDAYQYLADSIMDFPAPQDFRQTLDEAGFIRTGFKPYTFGVAVLFWGEKPAARDIIK